MLRISGMPEAAYAKRIRKVGGRYHETCKDFKYTDIEQYCEKGRMRRVPDVLPVCMQDFLYSREPDLRAEKITVKKM